MKLIDLKIHEFVHEIDSKSPAPGGGSAAALSSAIGVALMRMVGHLSIEKKKFLKLPDDVQQKFAEIFHALEPLKTELLELIDLDTEAFNEIMKAFALPKSTKDEHEIRQKAILLGTQKAIEIPQKVANLSLRALEDIAYLLEYGNQQTISDVGVAALTLATGIEGACLNVLINVSGLNDVSTKEVYKKEVHLMLQKTHALKNHCLEKIYEKLNGSF